MSAATDIARQWQSALTPAADVAGQIAGLSWVLIVGSALIFIGVMVLLAWAIWRGRAASEAGTRVRPAVWLVGGGLVFPAVVLVALGVYSHARTPDWLAQPPPGALVVSITAQMWWWEVRYRDPSTGQDVTLANELHLPVGRPVWLGLNSPNVIHSFWVPALGGKMDMVPGRVNHLLITPSVAGTWRGQCAEFCGEQHARMALHVVAKDAADFDRWLAAQAKPAAPADTAALAQGRDAFAAQRCNACHTVRGEFEEGKLGPDLTHVGSRLFLGAGTLRNQPGAMAHWVADTQAIKPGARMPSSPATSLDDVTALNALSAYLDHLQ